MSEYSVEEVRESARKAAASNGRAKEASMLFAYAERIKADEEAVPVAMVVSRSGDPEEFGERAIEYSDAIQKLPYNTPLFTRPPAQAAPVAEIQKGDAGSRYAVHFNHDEARRLHDLPAGTKLFTRPPAQAAQVDDKVVVIRDVKSTLEGIVLAAAIYMGAVKDIFKLRPNGSPYNERSVLKDTDALRAFDHLDAAGKALHAAISHFKAPTAEPVAQGEAVKRWPFVESPGEFTSRLQAAMREFPLLGAVRHVLIEDPPTLAAQPRAVPDGWALVPREPTEAMLDSYRFDPTAPCDRVARVKAMWHHMLAAAPSPGESA